MKACLWKENTLCNSSYYAGVWILLLLLGKCIQGPVTQRIVSLTTLLRRQLVKYMPTSLSDALLFFVGKM